MNKATKNHIYKRMEDGIRFDGRGKNEFRDITIETGVSATAEGSARVKFGNNEVIAGVKLAIGTPFPDTPDEGVLMVNVEKSPLANSKFEGGPPGIDAIELSRVIDRGIREGHMMDNTTLCIESGEKVWMVTVDICPINADGNLFDICALAAIAAIKDTKFPAVNEDGKVEYRQKAVGGELKLINVPVSVTVYKFGKHIIVDPTDDEIEAADARLTCAFVKEGHCVAMQKGGDATLSLEEIGEMVNLAAEKSKELRALIE